MAIRYYHLCEFCCSIKFISATKPRNGIFHFMSLVCGRFKGQWENGINGNHYQHQNGWWSDTVVPVLSPLFLVLCLYLCYSTHFWQSMCIQANIVFSKYFKMPLNKLICSLLRHYQIRYPIAISIRQPFNTRKMHLYKYICAHEWMNWFDATFYD